MDYPEILDQLIHEIQQKFEAMKTQNQNLKIQLHQNFDDLESYINQHPDESREDSSELQQKMKETDKKFIDSQKMEFLIKIMNLIIKMIKQKLFLQYDLNQYLTYLKYMIIQYYDIQEFEKIIDGIKSYFLNCSCIIKGNNKLDFFTTNIEEGYYFLNNFLQLKKISKGHFIHRLYKNQFKLPIIDGDIYII